MKVCTVAWPAVFSPLFGFTFKITDEVVYAILAITPLIVLFLTARNPLKVVGVKNGEVTLRVLHADYADSLSRLNAQGGAGPSR